MKISKKCQYALKAVFELAWRNETGPIKTYNIAQSQQMSARFTEIILNQLRHGGFVESRRGNEGGYMLAKDASLINVRDIIECIEGPISIIGDNPKNTVNHYFPGNEAFKELWNEMNNSVCEVCEQKTFAELVAFERVNRDKHVPNYTI